MSDRELKITAGVCGALLALAGALALLSRLILGLLGAADAAVGIIGGAQGWAAILVSGSSRGFWTAVFLVLALALVGLAGSLAALWQRRNRRGDE